YQQRVEGEFREKPEQAYESAIEAAQTRITNDLNLTAPPPGELVRERFHPAASEESKEILLGKPPAYKITLDLKLTRRDYLELAEVDRATRVTERMGDTARG